MQKILVYSIIRNEEKYIDRYHKQLVQMAKKFSDYEFYLSIYENDSSDNTVKKIESKDWSAFKGFSFISETLDTIAYGSVRVSERVKNLALARNRAIEVNDWLSECDYVMMVESDMLFDMDTVEKILNFKNVEPEFDIVSGITIREDGLLYDSWATRKRPRFVSHEYARSFDFKSKSYDKYYSTSNGICLYRAKPFQEGLRYHWINTRTRTFDCDTVVVCQNFIGAGYKNIYIIHDAPIYHENSYEIINKKGQTI